MEITPVLFDSLFDSRSVAELLGVRRETVRRWVRSGFIRPEAVAGNSYVFTRAEVERVRHAQRPKAGRPRKQRAA